MEENSTTIVIDNGTAITKAGCAGDDFPLSVIPTVLGVPKSLHTLVGMDTKSLYVGYEAISNRNSLNLSYPVEAGYITNWEDMEKLWHHVFYNEVRVNPQEQAVLLTEAPENPGSYRERTTQIMFETFNVPALYIQSQPVLSLYTYGKTTGTVIDSGEGTTNILSINEGSAIPESFRRIEFGGKDITSYLSVILNERGYSFSTPNEMEIVRDIKEKLCYVAESDYDQELHDSLNNSSINKSYEMPDGQYIDIGNERFRAPEIMLQPNFIGLE